MSLPLPGDLAVEDATEEEKAEALALAVRVAEMLAGRAIMERELHQDVYLGGTSHAVALDHWPVRDVRVDGAESPRGFWSEAEPGFVGAHVGVPASSYRVDFRVGCAEVPVILEVLIQQIAEHRLGAGPGAEEILDVAASAASMLDLPAAERVRFKEKVV